MALNPSKHKFKKFYKRIVTTTLHFGSALAFLYLAYQKTGFYPLLLGLGGYLLVVLIVFRIIPRHHNEGMFQMSKKNYFEAFACFEKSQQFFSKYKFFDQYGFIFLLNMSEFTYLESALLNQAHLKTIEPSNGQTMFNLDEAQKLYESVLHINPNNRLAKIGIARLGKSMNSEPKKT